MIAADASTIVAWIKGLEGDDVALARGLKACLADAMIAQACMDADVALITRDADFRHFARHCGLRLAI